MTEGDFMDDDNLLIICRSCGRKQLMHNMKADGEHMICLDCAKKGSTAKSDSALFAKKTVENAPFSGPKGKSEKSKSEKMTRYICTACKYKFSRKESQPVEKCPYCGKTTIVHDDQLGAEKLISQSMEKRFDW